jgi:DUF1365 family protein
MAKFETTHQFYEGVVVHERYEPKHHKLQYKVFQAYIDLDRLEELNTISPLWSLEKWNIVSFYRKDYLPGKDSLKETVIDKIKSDTGKTFSGRVVLVANLRYYGYCYNPVSFYLCYDKDEQLNYILADIHNTPWGERHCYVHDCLGQNKGSEQEKQPPLSTEKSKHQEISHKKDISGSMFSSRTKYSFHFDKKFHVSPFMPMNLAYAWHYTIRQNDMVIHMELFNRTLTSKQAIKKLPSKHQESTPEANERQLQFYANMRLKRIPFSSKNALRLPLQYPFLCMKVLVAIYWNALKLWIKKVPFHTHPDKAHNES